MKEQIRLLIATWILMCAVGIIRVGALVHRLGHRVAGIRRPVELGVEPETWL